MQSRMIANEYRTTVVCVDSYQDNVMKGRLANLSLSGPVRFESLMQFILQMEALLDGMRFPQPFNEIRSFAPISAPSMTVLPGEAEQEGKLATFLVKVVFRQNASWQGSVTWKEQKREESFRSALELVLLMHSALAADGEIRETTL